VVSASSFAEVGVVAATKTTVFDVTSFLMFSHASLVTLSVVQAALLQLLA